MTAAALTLHERDRLLKLLRLLGSDQLGERAAAGAAAHALAQSLGGWDLIIPPAAGEGSHELFLRADRQHHRLREWDRAFLRSIGPKIGAGVPLTERQQRQLHRIALEAEARAA